MNAFITQPVMQLIIWGIGLVELILALYILAINAKHVANRHVSALFILFAINSLALGSLVGAKTAAEGNIPAAILAATTPVFGLALLVTSIVLVKPKWIFSRLRWFWFVLYGLLALPIIITIIDLTFHTNIWFVGLNPDTYSGGYISLAEYTNPELSILRIASLSVIPVIALLPLLYLSFFDKELITSRKFLARVLLAGQIGATLFQVFFGSALQQPFPTVLTNLIFFSVYAYASFSQSISERRLQRGRLQNRLTIVILVISVPLLFFIPAYLFGQTSIQIRQDAVDRLDQTAQSVASSVDSWLGFNTKALEQLISQPGIRSMDPSTQKPILVSMNETYAYMYLVSTTDQSGINIARSDDANLTNYSDRSWFREAIEGADVAFQTLIGRTSGEPAIVISKPIYSNGGEITGVGMFASGLNSINADISDLKIGETGSVFVVDSKNLVVAHTDPKYANQLIDFSLHPAVAAMRNLDQDNMRYHDQNGITWIVYFQELENGWGVVVQQDETELLASLLNLQIITWITIIISAIILGGLTSLAVRQAIAPINSLTETATAIAAGDLSRVAPIESEDEFGVLARAFNRMTEQLLELIGGLEQRMTERTRDLENRSQQLEAAAEVGQASSSFLDVNELIQTTVELIRGRFALYYVGLFLVDKPQEYAVLRAGTGEAGKTMLARQHMIQIGEGMIGWTVANGQSRVASDAGEDAVRLATKELPKTRSEAAIPLRSRGQILGAISVQSSRSDAFDESTMAVLQTMADLVSVAIDNARLYTETEAALQSTMRAYSERSHEDWLETLQKRPDFSFRSDRSGIASTEEIWTPEMRKAWVQETTIVTADNNGVESIHPLAIPIKVRGNVIGVIQTHKTDQTGKWTDEERIMLEAIIEQLGLALDSARLYSDTQTQAERERLTHEVTDKLHRSPDMDALMQTLLQEISTALGASSAFVQLSAVEQSSDEGDITQRGTGFLPPLENNPEHISTPEETSE